MKTRQKLFRKHLRQLIDNTMDMHMAAMIPWRIGHFVALDVITINFTEADFEPARKAQQIADGFLWRMVYGG